MGGTSALITFPRLIVDFIALATFYFIKRGSTRPFSLIIKLNINACVVLSGPDTQPRKEPMKILRAGYCFDCFCIRFNIYPGLCCCKYFVGNFFSQEVCFIDGESDYHRETNFRGVISRPINPPNGTLLRIFDAKQQQ